MRSWRASASPRQSETFIAALLTGPRLTLRGLMGVYYTYLVAVFSTVCVLSDCAEPRLKQTPLFMRVLRK